MIINVQKSLPQSDEFTFTAIDFERANNSQNSVCQVGICAVERGRIIKSCEYLVRPPQRVFYFQKKAMEIHGITYLDVEDALTFDKVWKKILPYIEGRPLVANSFRDDAMTMDAILCSYRIKYHYQRYGHLCTLELAQRADIHGENNKYNLEALCGRYCISLEPHHAGSDAEGCAKLALALAEELSIDSFRSLADFSQTPDFHEPELPELLTHSDLDVLENYLHRLKKKNSTARRLPPTERPRQGQKTNKKISLRHHRKRLRNERPWAGTVVCRTPVSSRPRKERQDKTPEETPARQTGAADRKLYKVNI